MSNTTLAQSFQHSIVKPLSYGVNTLEVSVIWVHSIGKQQCDNSIDRVCTDQGPCVSNKEMWNLYHLKLLATNSNCYYIAVISAYRTITSYIQALPNAVILCTAALGLQ